MPFAATRIDECSDFPSPIVCKAPAGMPQKIFLTLYLGTASTI
jgi:hypothetical protein